MRVFGYLLTGTAAALCCLAAHAQQPNAIFYNASVSHDQQLAAQGNLSAHMRLGYEFLRGSAGAIDAEQARQHFQAVAQTGSLAASAFLGYTYITMHTPGHSATEGLNLIQNAAGAGDPVAKTLLGHLQDWGIGMPTNYAAAITLFEAAAPKFALAQTYLGESYLRRKTRADSAAAAKLLFQAAYQNETTAMVDLAGMFAQGNGVPQNRTFAKAWLDQAVKLGDVAAVFQLGYYYRNSTGTAHNPQKAIALYTQAATAGYVPAQSALGMCYAKGLGVQKDMTQATKWLSLAAPYSKFAAAKLAAIKTGGTL